MEEPKFNVGDVVVLNSGGPNMTVKSVGASSGVSCTWFDKLEQTAHAIFHPAMLTKQKCPDCGSPERDMTILKKSFSPKGNIV